MADAESEKAVAAARAVVEVEADMVVGLGTGSTTAYAIRELARRVAHGLKISATATSTTTGKLAASLGIPLVPFATLARVDLTIDGADEIDGRLRAIKGGGGALLREKLVAAASDRMIAIVDSGKAVAKLGRFPLPVEVLPFGYSFVNRVLADFGVPMARRLGADGSAFLTDQGAFLVDLGFGSIDDPEVLAARLDAIPGVLEHGLFLTEIDAVYIGRDGDVEVVSRDRPIRRDGAS